MPFDQQELLEWMGEHPILTVVILVVVLGGAADILHAIFH
jgi:hypothetical protein